MTSAMDRLVDAERGSISRRIFIEPEIHEKELQQIFARCWLFLCHDTRGRVTFSRPTWARTRYWSCATATARFTPS